MSRSDGSNVVPIYRRQRTMDRVTLRLSKRLLGDVDELHEDGEWSNRSEVMRAALRDFVDDQEANR